MQWREFERRQRHLPDDVWSQVPEKLAGELLREFVGDASSWSIRRRLAQRSPQSLLEILDDLAAAPLLEATSPEQSSPTLSLMFEASAELIPALLERVRQWRLAPQTWPGAPPDVNRWLLGLVEQRVPAWREAWALFREG